MAEVYALVCPITGEARYIGMSTRSAYTRYRCHLGPDALAPVRDWVTELRGRGLEPKLRVIAVGLSRADAVALERKLIAEGSGLLNRSRKRKLRPPYDHGKTECDMLTWWKHRTNLLNH